MALRSRGRCSTPCSTRPRVDAGATPFVGRAQEPLEEEGRIVGYRLSTGESLYADFVIGADGATSEVAAAAGLVDPNSVLWGFAVRTYLPQVVDLPAIVLWEPTPWRAFPGYGWVFPGRAGRRQRRARHRDPVRSQGRRPCRSGAARFPRAPACPWSPRRVGSLGAATPPRWLAQDGDRRDHAGEGAGPSGWRCRRSREPDAGGGDLPGHDQWSCCRGGDPQRARATQPRAIDPDLPSNTSRIIRSPPRCTPDLSGRPRATAAVARLLTAAGRGDALSGGWAVFWNELLDGAPPNRHRSVANAVTQIGRVMTAQGSDGQVVQDVTAMNPRARIGNDMSASA